MLPLILFITEISLMTNHFKLQVHVKQKKTMKIPDFCAKRPSLDYHT